MKHEEKNYYPQYRIQQIQIIWKMLDQIKKISEWHVLMVMELRDSIPGMKGRKLESQISEIVSKFVTNLTIQLEEVVEDDTLLVLKYG